MKDSINSTLVRYLGKQRYQYLWEVKLLSMSETKDIEEIRKFCENSIGLPKAAICLSQHLSKKGDNEIVDFIKKIQKNEQQVCIVTVHVNYNPANLQAIYLLDCKEGKEEESFLSVLKRWSKCSELYFFAMDVGFIIKEITESRSRLRKFKRFFLGIVHFLKGHDKDVIFRSNIYGDMITDCNGKRSIWECYSCGGMVYKDELHY